MTDAQDLEITTFASDIVSQIVKEAQKDDGDLALFMVLLENVAFGGLLVAMNSSGREIDWLVGLLNERMRSKVVAYRESLRSMQ